MDADLSNLARLAAQGDLDAARQLVHVLERDGGKSTPGRCRHCGSRRMARVSAKCSDACDVALRSGKWIAGYVPPDMGICDGDTDYVRFAWCLDCGTIRGRFPVKTTEIEEGRREAPLRPSRFLVPMNPWAHRRSRPNPRRIP